MADDESVSQIATFQDPTAQVISSIFLKIVTPEKERYCNC